MRAEPERSRYTGNNPFGFSHERVIDFLIRKVDVERMSQVS